MPRKSRRELENPKRKGGMHSVHACRRPKSCPIHYIVTVEKG